MSAGAVRVTSLSRLDGGQVRAVLDLVAAAAEADGISPVSEHVLLHLRHGGDAAARNVLGYRGDALAGYAHLDLTDLVDGPSAELAVHPGHRRRGVGSALVDELETTSPDGRLRLWAHGRRADAAALAHRRGYVEERILWQLRRSLLAQLPDATLPAGITLRSFRPGVDEPGWVALNNRAFADHPDQGGWTVADLGVREREPWFDPAGFLLAERETDGELVGFHWTKIHGAPPPATVATPDSVDSPGGPDTVDSHQHDPVGEVYVLGVDPRAAGHGLGAALTVAGLRHLRGRGLAQVLLYVDDSNPAALRLYERLGFTRWDVDVQYRRTGMARAD